jgi:glutathione S-transferase
MQLLGNALSPYAARVMIAARFKGIDLAVVPTAPQSSALLARSPIGKIPVLVDGDLVLPESDTILAYFEDVTPMPTLYPGDARSRALVRLMVRLMDGYSTPSFGPFLPDADPRATVEAMDRIRTALAYVDHFRPDGAFAAGNAFSAADCAWIPFFHFFERLDPSHGVFALVRRHPGLEAWWSRTCDSDLGRFARNAIDEELARFLAAGG